MIAKINFVSAMGYLIVFRAIAFVVQFSQSLQSETVETCQWESFNASCSATGSDAVLVIEAARFGRMRVGKCVTQGYGFSGCAADVLHYVDWLCSGRRQCKFLVPDEYLRSMKPCPKDFAFYLEASYSCVRVQPGPEGPCDSPIIVQMTSAEEEGYLASVVTQESGYGSADCPWVIRALPGQRVQLKLFDFTYRMAQNDLHFPPSSSPTDDAAVAKQRYTSSSFCQKYADVLEPQAGRETVVCGTELREKSVYVSVTEEIIVKIEKGALPKKAGVFLIQYEAAGCPMPAAPPFGWVQRTREGNKDHVVMGCNHTSQKWFLRCEGRHWVGLKANCSQPPDSAETYWPIYDDWSSPYGILIVAALGVALGLVIGVCLLGVVVLFMRRGHYCSSKNEMSYEMTSHGHGDDVHCTYVIQNKGNPATMLADNFDMPCLHDVSNYGSMWRTAPTPSIFRGDANGLPAEQTLDVLQPVRQQFVTQHRCRATGPGHVCLQTPDYDIAAALDPNDIRSLHICNPDAS